MEAIVQRQERRKLVQQEILSVGGPVVDIGKKILSNARKCHIECLCSGKCEGLVRTAKHAVEQGVFGLVSALGLTPPTLKPFNGLAQGMTSEELCP